MKVYLYANGITMVGKAWQIRAKLRELQKVDPSLQNVLTKHQRLYRKK